MTRPVGIVIQTALFVVWACSCSVAQAGPVFRLAPDSDLSVLPKKNCVLERVRGVGRYGGPAIRITPATDPTESRFRIFAKPRFLVTPGQYRVEAWVRAENAKWHIDLVLHDAETQGELARYAMRARTAVSLPGGHAGWRFEARDVSLDEGDGGAVRFNIEVAVHGGPGLLDGLKVAGSGSILRGGDFSEIDPVASSEGGQAARKTLRGVPRGWRRQYDHAAAGDVAMGFFGVEERAGANVLVVEKTNGAFVVSAEPIATPKRSSGLVAWARLDEGSDLLPTVVLRQYGPRGLLAEDRSDKVLRGEQETIVATDRVECHREAERIRLLLHFPEPAGTYRVQSLELSSLAAEEHEIEILIDQVGYNVGEPFRLLVATQTFPTQGPAAFRLVDPHGRTYESSLTALGRAVGQNESDWGRYYFEGIVAGPAPGSYDLIVELGDRSATIQGVHVAPTLRLRQTGELAYRFYYVQRCGHAVPGWHGLCHMDDAKLPDGTHVDVTGGYHNAGDFHKHMMDNTPVSVYAMMRAYETHRAFFDAIDRDDNQRADILDEAVWGAAWLRKMVNPKTGRIWMNVTNDIDYYGTPERDTDGIPGTADDRLVGTTDPPDLGAFTIAAWAALSRYVPDAAYLEDAEKLWSVYEDRIVTGYNARHVLSALELRRSTRNAEYELAARRIVRNLLTLQDGQGWFARRPDGGPELKLVDEGTTPAGLARYSLAEPESPLTLQAKESLRRYFAWSFRMADNPFGLIRNYTGGEPFYFKSRDAWFGGGNSQYCSTAWAAFLAARVFEDEPMFASRLRAHAANQVHWILGINPLDLCMFEGKGNSGRIYYHHLYAEIPGHPRGAVPGAVPNGIAREPGNADRPWFDLRSGTGSLPGAESAEPWLPHNAYYLLVLSAGG